MSKVNGKNRLWTKQDIKKVATLWDENTTQDIADELGVEPRHVTYIAKCMRDAGFNLPRKSKRGYLHGLLKEVLKETR